MGQAFDSKKYLKAQREAIEDRLSRFSDRLYLEFGGKLIDDFHATRTLPGYEANNKLKLLLSLKRKVGVILCVSAKQLSDGKIRGDSGQSYKETTIKALKDLQEFGLEVEGVVINRYEGEKEADNLIRRLKLMKVRVTKRKEIKNYPKDLKLTISENGFGSDEYLKVKNKLIVVWGAGPGSGKLSTCLGQIYHEEKRGENSGYAKFETFPVWNLPLKHPVNIAYEAATADLGDFSLIDPWHGQAYGVKAVNYNRDVSSFPVIKEMFSRILGKNNFSKNYQSPTDMGVNRLSMGMIDDDQIREAAKKEICFYWYRYVEEYKKGVVKKQVLRRMQKLMKEVNINEDYLATIVPARKVEGAAIELHSGEIVVGKNKKLLRAEAAVILNSLKILAGIEDKYNLISESVLKEILKFNKNIGRTRESLTVSETLLALAVSGRDNPLAKRALEKIKDLKNCFMHSVLDLKEADKRLFWRLNLWTTTDGK